MTTLYRLFDEGGTLLYVGISERALRRMAEHEDSKPWWFDVRSATFETFASRGAAEDAETRAIGSEHPVYNVRDNIEPGATTDHEARRERRAFAEVRRFLDGGPDYSQGPYLVACPACTALDFEPCKTLRGDRREEPHSARVKAHGEAFCPRCGCQDHPIALTPR